jgi:hypothetical protein
MNESTAGNLHTVPWSAFTKKRTPIQLHSFYYEVLGNSKQGHRMEQHIHQTLTSSTLRTTASNSSKASGHANHKLTT